MARTVLCRKYKAELPGLATPPRLGLAAPVKTLLKRAAAELNAGEMS